MILFMKNIVLSLKVSVSFILLLGMMSSCWAPRCPMDTCRSKYEHRHADMVSGVFSPRYGMPHKIHFLWDQDKGEENPDTDFVPGSNAGGKKKTKKRYPWEKW